MRRRCRTAVARALLLAVGGLALAGCGSLRNTAKYALHDGTYSLRRAGQSAQRVYLETTDETLTAYPLGAKGRYVPDSARAVTLAFPLKAPALLPRQVLVKSSFDLDVLTIPFKFRPATAGRPPQLNTSFSGGTYVGYRRDRFSLQYRATPIGTATRELVHYGFSAGGFVGLGSAPITAVVVGGSGVADYEGVVLLTGAAMIVGVENLTLGLAVGTDRLLDRNHSRWTYAGQPWVGFAFGLNLN